MVHSGKPELKAGCRWGRAASGRRDFLKVLGLGGLGVAGCGRPTGSEAQGTKAQPADALPPADAGLPQPAAPGKSRVVIARAPDLIAKDGRVDAAKVAALLGKAMKALTGAGDEREAWRGLFRAEDLVALKANALAGPLLSTHPEVCYAIADGLRRAGLQDERILVYDRDYDELQELGFEPPPGQAPLKLVGTNQVGYDAEVTTIKEVGTRFSRVISEMATAIINVPVLKDHDLAGLSGALKNHYGSISNPNKLHLDHCYPYIADLNCAEVLRHKQRLVVMDALQVCYDGGPAFSPAATVPHGALIVATDPVAADAVGLAIIESLRKEHGLKPLRELERAPKYIDLAAQYGLGNAAEDRIERMEV